MRVVVASQYYAPEVGATQNRMLSFVDGLREAGHDVVVVCEQPNHPAGIFHAGYGRRPLRRERASRLVVNRVWVLASPRKTTLRRLLFYATFAVGAFLTTLATRRADVVLVTSPPLPGALGAALAARLRGIPLVVDVRDLWPAAAEALGELSHGRVLRVFEHAERWLYRTAVAVTATTRPFCRHIDAVAGRAVATHVPNGALDDLVARPSRSVATGSPFRIGYIGNFGIAQGLGIVLDAAEELRGDDVEFLLVGAGPMEAQLRAAVTARGLANVRLSAPVPPTGVGEVMESCHALLVPLRDHPLLGDFIPSKLYDTMAVGRPAIVAARGEAAEFVTSQGFGLVVAPEDGVGLSTAVRRLAADPDEAAALGALGKAASPAYSRSAQARALVQLLESACGPA